MIKRRIARAGAGKSGGYRTIIFYREGQSAIFMFGFAKSDRENSQPKPPKQMDSLAEKGEFIEVIWK